jgi:hypothetical protein
MELTILIRIINPVNKLKKVLSFLLRAERDIRNCQIVCVNRSFS